MTTLMHKPHIEHTWTLTRIIAAGLSLAVTAAVSLAVVLGFTGGAVPLL